MSKWKMVRLNKVVTLLNGRAFKQEELLKEGITPVLRVGNFFSNRDWYYSDLTLEENKYCNKGDLLYAWSASFGPMIWLGSRAIYHYHIWKIVLGNTINKNYLYYVLEYKTREIISGGHGIAMIHATKSGMENMLIPLPPLDEQRKIAATLDAVSDLLNLRKQKLVELDKLIESVFYDMFGDPVTNEKGWEKRKFSECCQINPRKSEIEYFTDTFKVSFVSMPKVSENGQMDATEVRHYKEVKTGFTYFYEGDVLFAKITPCMENGKGAIAKNLINKIGFGSTEFHVFRPIYGVSNSDWIYCLSTLSVFRKNAEKNMTGSAGQKRVPLNFFDKFIVSLPPIQLQNEFASIVLKIEEQKVLVQQSIDETQELFDSLMSEYFDE